MAFPDGPKMVTEPITTSGDLGDSVSSFFPNHITDMFWLIFWRSLISIICLLRWAWSVRWILIHHQPTPGLRVILARFEKRNFFSSIVDRSKCTFPGCWIITESYRDRLKEERGTGYIFMIKWQKILFIDYKIMFSLQYLCHSMTDGFPLLSSKPASILLQGPPVIQSPQVRGRCWKWWWLWIMTLSICVKAC